MIDMASENERSDPQFVYTVWCTFQSEEVADEWVRWLEGEHLADVCDAGAEDAEVVKLDGAPVTCVVRYHFPSRDVFDTYERDHAPRLRGEGMKRFPPDRGLTYERSFGEVIARYPGESN
jgi:hypothetical protein